MANLFDTVKNNRQTYKQGGEMQDSSTEELQKLTRNAGMPTPPSSPLSAQGIGANADQAKMLGTPAQQTAAINIATAPGMDLQTQVREAQARKQQSAQEAADQKRALSFEGFGSLGERVQQIATKMFNQNGTAIAATQVADPSKFADHLAPGADANETEALLNKVGAGTASNADILKVAQNLGYKDVNDIPALTDSIKNSFLSNAENEANFTANAIPDQAKVSDFTPAQIQQLGFTDVNAMAAALQVDPDTLSGMSIKDLQNQFGKEQMEDFGKVAAAQATLADASTSRAEKEAALKQLRELGATGVRAVEGDVKRLENQVANADVVRFNGTEYRMEDLLKSDTIKGVVQSYLVDDDVAKALQISEPGFANWIEDNKKVLSLATANVQANVDGFKAVQEQNRALQNPKPGVRLDSSVMRLLFPGWGSLSATQYQAPEVLKTIQDAPPEDASVLAGTLTDLANTVPEAAKGLATATNNDLVHTGISTREGAAAYSKYVHAVDDLKDVSDPNIIASRLFPGIPQQALAQTGEEAKVLESFGFSLDHSQLDIVTATGQAQKDKFFAQVSGYNPDGSPFTVAQMAKAYQKATNFQSGPNIVSSVRAQLEAKNKDPLFFKYGHYWAETKDLKPSDAITIGTAAVDTGSVGEYNDLRKLVDTAKMNDESRGILKDKLNQAGAVVAQKALEKAGGYGSRQEWDADIAELNNATITGSKVGQHQKVSNALKQLQAVKGDPTMQGPEVQAHLNWRINEMQKAISKYESISQDTMMGYQASGGYFG